MGSLPFLRSSASPVVAPAFCVVWLESTPEFVAVYKALPSTRSSRAPPA
ncbi:MAG TPA: hypothetical protein VHW09_13895 [Bryobacteraceae bacterium]|nr:hypothetical protein [Bryobacteraceae bacterium]